MKDCTATASLPVCCAPAIATQISGASTKPMALPGKSKKSLNAPKPAWRPVCANFNAEHHERNQTRIAAARQPDGGRAQRPGGAKRSLKKRTRRGPSDLVPRLRRFLRARALFQAHRKAQTVA